MKQCLIAHKVRGEPAFDIAEKMIVGEEEWWIISTSGHRAYPYWSTGIEQFMQYVPSMPLDTPEHFEVSAAPKGKGSKTNGRDLLVQLGLAKPIEPLKRRSW